MKHNQSSLSNKPVLLGTSLGVVMMLINLSSSLGQSNTVSAGGDAEGSNGSVSYSIGQVFYVAAEGENGNVNQGVQQPYDAEIITGIERKDIRAVIYPNPTLGQIQLQFDSDSYANYRAELIDATGRLIIDQNQLASSNTFSLEMASSGIYTLLVYQNNKLVKSFRVVKGHK
jgi:hypothetical protein